MSSAQHFADWMTPSKRHRNLLPTDPIFLAAAAKTEDEIGLFPNAGTEEEKQSWRRRVMAHLSFALVDQGINPKQWVYARIRRA